MTSQELDLLKCEIASRTGHDLFHVASKENFPNMQLTIVVLGASGNLAKVKTYPALLALYFHNLLPKNVIIAGYSRTELERQKFLDTISIKFDSAFEKVKAEFLDRCFYFAGKYDSAEDFAKLDVVLDEKEAERTSKAANFAHNPNRLFYLAIPPSIYVPSAKAMQTAQTKKGWNRIIIEKPFGKDSQSSLKLGEELGTLFRESQMYRIDHYLGKEMAQNLMVLRFANNFFEPTWNARHVKAAIISNKMDFGTEGRGGYFDEYGIIRDMLQNHLLQVLALVAMEEPVSLSAQDVRDQKVKLLKAAAPLVKKDTVMCVYTRNGKHPGFLEDPTVSKTSTTATFAAVVLRINNTKWHGVPFILKAGYGVGKEKKTDIRIQYKTKGQALFPDAVPNELVLMVQPEDCIYVKLNTKLPGLEGGLTQAELDLSYKKRFNFEEPDAYERLIWDVLRGDHSLFVRSDELVAAWKIFTPILHQLESEKEKPYEYKFGERAPKAVDELVTANGFIVSKSYKWKTTRVAAATAVASPAAIDPAAAKDRSKSFSSRLASKKAAEDLPKGDGPADRNPPVSKAQEHTQQSVVRLTGREGKPALCVIA